MKRRDLIRHLISHGCELLREGARHTMYWNPANRCTTAIPRHRELRPTLIRKICQDLGVPEP